MAHHPSPNVLHIVLADYVVLCRVVCFLFCRHNVLCRRHVSDMSVLMSARGTLNDTTFDDMSRHVVNVCNKVIVCLAHTQKMYCSYDSRTFGLI